MRMVRSYLTLRGQSNIFLFRLTAFKGQERKYLIPRDVDLRRGCPAYLRSGRTVL